MFAVWYVHATASRVLKRWPIKIPYSGKLSREKTFADFVDLCSAMSFLCELFGGMMYVEGVWYVTRNSVTRSRHIWCMHTQGVLAQVLSDKLIV